MITYIVGDIHGCSEELTSLLQLVSFNPSVDTLVSCGDFTGVNKGYDSVGVIKILMQNDALPILGNHEVANLFESRQYKSHVADFSNGSNSDLHDMEYVAWLRDRALLMAKIKDCYVIHAATPVDLSCEASLDLAQETLKSLWDDYDNFTQESGRDRQLQKSINAFNYRRMYTQDGRPLEYDREYESLQYPTIPTETVITSSGHYKPWYLVADSIKDCMQNNKKVIFGHWARLGVFLHNTGQISKQQHAVCLDTGCVYGVCLTMLALEDGMTWQVPYKRER